MGLAPYGVPRYEDLILTHLVDLKEDGSFALDQRYFNYLTGLTMTSEAFHELFGGPPRTPETQLTQREMDLARSVQDACEKIMMHMARTAHRETGMDNLCMAGGVALNCVGNGKLLRDGPFKRIWIQPASGDAGGALGVAHLAWHRDCNAPRTVVPGRDRMNGAIPRPRVQRRRDRGVPQEQRGGVQEDDQGPPRTDRYAWQRCSQRGTSSAGSTDAWSSARARSAAARSLATRAARRCSPT